MTSQMLWPSATTNSGCLAAAKVCTKLAAKISPNGNTGRQLDPAAAALALPARCCVRGVPAAHLQKRGCHKRTGIGFLYGNIYNLNSVNGILINSVNGILITKNRMKYFMTLY